MRVCPHCEYDLDRGIEPEPSVWCPDCNHEVCLACPGDCPCAAGRDSEPMEQIPAPRAA